LLRKNVFYNKINRQGVIMKIVSGFVLVFCLLSIISCDQLLPVDYDKAGRDLMVMMNRDSSFTVSDFKKSINETGMSSKDFFTLMKSDSSSNDLIQFLELDMAKNLTKDLDVDINNLKRALKN